MGFSVQSDKKIQYTMISNEFISHHMLSANGDYVKVFLMLQLINQNPSAYPQVSIQSLADDLECTEGDITRALNYWAKKDLLTLVENDQEIASVTLHIGEGEAVAPSQPAPETPAPSPAPKAPAPKPINHPGRTLDINEKNNYTPSLVEPMAKDKVIKDTLDRVQEILGKPLDFDYIQSIVYFICDADFSPDLVVAMYKEGVSKGHTKLSYIEKIGLNWAEKSIATPDEAQIESQKYNSLIITVKNAFGLQRNLGESEVKMVQTWGKAYPDLEIIKRACTKCLLKKSEVNFTYTDGIIKGWIKEGLKTLQDIEKSEEEYKKKIASKKKEGTKKAKNQFQNFPQRDYSERQISDLEKQLLQGKKA
ncbi:MAG: DnaD domain protein [Eubacterium sp.]|nr:DnaD domain protein [Eubacterium sp.]